MSKFKIASVIVTEGFDRNTIILATEFKQRCIDDPKSSFYDMRTQYGIFSIKKRNEQYSLGDYYNGCIITAINYNPKTDEFDFELVEKPKSTLLNNTKSASSKEPLFYTNENELYPDGNKVPVFHLDEIHVVIAYGGTTYNPLNFEVRKTNAIQGMTLGKNVMGIFESHKAACDFIKLRKAMYLHDVRIGSTINFSRYTGSYSGRLKRWNRSLSSGSNIIQSFWIVDDKPVFVPKDWHLYYTIEGISK